MRWRRNGFPLAALLLLASPVSGETMALHANVADGVASSIDLRGLDRQSPRCGFTIDGSSIGLAYIIPFELPLISGSLQSVDFVVRIAGVAGVPSFNADVYGLLYRNSGDLRQTDFYGGPYADPGSHPGIPIADDFLTPANAEGESVHLSQNTALKSYVQGQIDAGAGAGDFLFLRLSPDPTTFPADFVGYNIHAAEAAAEADRPRLVLRFSKAESPSPVITEFVVDDHYIQPGEEALFSWQARDFDTLILSDGVRSWDLLAPGITNPLPLTFPESREVTLIASTAMESVRSSVLVEVGPPRPNLLLFLVDDMGWQDTSVPFLTDSSGIPQVTSLNERYRTPHMEGLASQGMRLTSAYTLPVCTPSRTSLMTGLNAARHHVTNFTKPDLSESYYMDSFLFLDPPPWLKEGIDPAIFPTLPQLLGENGYRTLHVGKAHFGPTDLPAGNPVNLGFDINIAGNGIGRPGSYYGTDNFGAGTNRAVPHMEAYFGQDIFLTEALTQEMVREITTSVDLGKPFFAYMSHYAIHTPFQPDPRFAPNYPDLGPDERAYATLIEGMDKSLGDLLTALRNLGVAEDTLVLFLSDNGGNAPMWEDENNPRVASNAPLRGRKGMRYEGGIRVPAIASWASNDPVNAFQSSFPIPANSLSGSIVSIEDWFPTLLSVAGIDSPPVDGTDISPVLKGEPSPRPQILTLHFPHDHKNAYFSVYREDNYKLIVNYGDYTHELYDLDADLSESNNLIDSTPARAASMAYALAYELQSFGAQYPVYDSNGDIRGFRVPEFPELDLDGDGLKDAEEDTNRNGLLDESETDPQSVDTDLDGGSDFLEWATGLDPRDPSRRFALHLSQSAGNKWHLTFPSRNGFRYWIQSASSPTSTWADSPGLVTGDAVETSLLVSQPTSAIPVFFRFGVREDVRP